MTDLTPDQRIAGVLAPVFALRGSLDLGIGDTLALREFATWAAKHGLRVLQILPVSEPGADHSPYNIISSMALDPATIATFPSELPDITERDFKRITSRFDLEELREGPVHHGKVRQLKRALLEAAHAAFRETADEERTAAFNDFASEHDEWLAPYADYRALVSLHGESEVFSLWPVEHQTPVAAQAWLQAQSDAQRDEIDRLKDLHRYIQWIAFTQWQQAHAHCRDLGVALMGDVPVGVSIYSADVWAEPEIFDLTRSSGAPPEKVFKSDPFTEKWGQNWGFPLYDWLAMSRDNFAWWRRRLRAMGDTFDLIRVDHALGFFRIYSFPWRPERNAEFLDLTKAEAKAQTDGRLPGFVPADDSTPENEKRNRQHGEVIFKIMLEEIPAPCLIAEDLGVVPDYVRPALADLDVPGFKIPQWERPYDGAPTLTPGKDYQRLSLTTYATHDHPPVRTFWNAWYMLTQRPGTPEAEHAMAEMNALLAFCGEPPLSKPRAFDAKIHQATMRGLMATNSWLAVPMITDILGTEDRFNVPGAIGDQNWSARLGTTTAGLDRDYRAQLKSLRQILTQTGRIAK